MADIKQVIVIRKDLKMRRGKEVAQGAHASIAFLTRRIQAVDDGARIPEQATRYGDFSVWDLLGLTIAQRIWIKGIFAKVCLQVPSEEELLAIHERAKAAGLESHLITDSGLTEFDGVPTHTCLAIGPDYAEKIDAVTGELKLY